MPGEHKQRHAKDADIHQVLADAVCQGANFFGAGGQRQGPQNSGENAASEPLRPTRQAPRGGCDDSDKQGGFQRFAKNNQCDGKHVRFPLVLCLFGHHDTFGRGFVVLTPKFVRSRF
jgi:hypothetical protein